MIGSLRFAAAILTAAVATSAASEPAPGYGHLAGQFVFDGDPPLPQVLVNQGDKDIPDAAVCAQQALYDESLLVDPKSKGIANIFVFLKQAVAIHPDLKEPPKTEVVTEFDGCRIIPRALIVRTRQTLRWKGIDAIQHSPHDYLIRNQSACSLLAPRSELAHSYLVAEPLPLPLKCDIHRWERANWLIVDHPYAAITDADGQFRIEKLPAGEHEFRVWHERAGWIERSLRATITADTTTEMPARRLDPKILEKFVERKKPQ